MEVSGQQVSILDRSKAHVRGHVARQLLVALVQELDGYRDGELHDRLLVVVEEDTAHDVGGHLGMRRVTLAGGSEAVGKT